MTNTSRARNPALRKPLSIDDQGPEKILKDAASQSLVAAKGMRRDPKRGDAQPPARQTSPPVDQPREMDRETVEALVRELKDSLQKAEELGTTIRHLLVELVSKQQLVLPAMESFLQKAQRIGGTNDAFPRRNLPEPSRQLPRLPGPGRPRRASEKVPEPLAIARNYCCCGSANNRWPLRPGLSQPGG